MKLSIGYLYADIMSHYGDYGNICCLTKRCQWRGIAAEVLELGLGEAVDPTQVDFLLIGGGADSHQRLIAEDLLQVKGEGIRQVIEEGGAALAICGGYQLWGRYYQSSQGEALPGLGIFDAYTVHWIAGKSDHIRGLSSAARGRFVGNIVVQWGKETLVGFENHGGRTHLNPGTQPLGRVLVGHGNNGRDGSEGAICKNAIGTYLHGPILPKNPHLTDFLIQAALSRRYGAMELKPLDDGLEWEAHRQAVSRAKALGRWPLPLG